MERGASASTAAGRAHVDDRRDTCERDEIRRQRRLSMQHVLRTDPHHHVVPNEESGSTQQSMVAGMIHEARRQAQPEHRRLSMQAAGLHHFATASHPARDSRDEEIRRDAESWQGDSPTTLQQPAESSSTSRPVEGRGQVSAGAVTPDQQNTGHRFGSRGLNLPGFELPPSAVAPSRQRTNGEDSNMDSNFTPSNLQSSLSRGNVSQSPGLAHQVTSGSVPMERTVSMTNRSGTNGVGAAGTHRSSAMHTFALRDSGTHGLLPPMPPHPLSSNSLVRQLTNQMTMRDDEFDRSSDSEDSMSGDSDDCISIGELEREVEFVEMEHRKAHEAGVAPPRRYSILQRNQTQTQDELQRQLERRRSVLERIQTQTQDEFEPYQDQV